MLTMDPVVEINVDISSGSRNTSAFDVGAIITTTAGTTVPLTVTNRYMEYTSLSEMLDTTSGKTVFATTTEVYKDAEKYFGTSPAPKKLVVIFCDAPESGAISAAAAIVDAIEKGADFYGICLGNDLETSANLTAANITSIASALSSLKKGIFFYSAVNADIAALVPMISDNERALAICAKSVKDSAAVMGMAMGLARTHANRAFALCYKPIATATACDFTQSQINTIKAANGNVFVSRARNRAGLENGSVGSGLRFDEVFFVDRIVYDLQNSIYSMIADNPDKLPQTDSTTQLFKAEIFRIMEQYYGTGVLATSPWRGRPIGTVDTGDILEHGYTAFAESFDNQSDADRAQHKAMPITILACLSGSVESIVINLSVRT